MPRTKLTKAIARKKSITDVCIDEKADIWVTIKTPSPTILLELESVGKEGSFPLIFQLVKDCLIEPKIVDAPSDKENEMTMDELGGYFLATATAIMDSVDPSGEARKKAESFLADQPGADGRSGGNGVPHATVHAPSV